MEEGQKRLITITIYENKIPMYINPEDEEMYRKAEVELKNLLNDFANTFVGKGRETILCCAAYQLMLDKLLDVAECEKISGCLDNTLSNTDNSL
ncbi:MAG: cell division protein ZapA [Paludibacteraceae bacterium]|nr:cell division protein ZapA [Paludibacteraceae bacterium]